MPKTKLSPMSFPAGAIPTQPFTSPAQTPAPAVKFPTKEVTEKILEDIDGTQEEEQDINPPDDWLQPKIYKGASVNQPNQPDSYSENKG